MGGAKAHYDGIVAFSQTDFTEDLKKITVPVLVMHGDDDQIVPYADSGPLSAKLVQNGTLKTYAGFPTACRPPRPRRSTPICWRSSSPEGVVSPRSRSVRGSRSPVQIRWTGIRVPRQTLTATRPVRRGDRLGGPSHEYERVA